MIRVLSFALALLAGFTGFEVYAKDFYMTVRRDFSPSEKPEIDLDYRTGEPVLIRVLKPKDLPRFVASQLDLRRAWRMPKVEDNLANAVVSGFNTTWMDFDWLRVSLNSDFRKSVKDKLGGGQWGSSGGTGQMALGPSKLISQADDYELVQEFSMFPNESDAKREFDVPGFYYGENGGFSTVPVRLNPLPVGFYVVQVIQGKAEGQVVLVVNDLSVHMQQSSNRALVRVVGRDARPVSGARVRARNLQGQWVADAKTDAQGVVDLTAYNTTDSVVMVEAGGRGTAILDGEFFSTTVLFPDVYLYSDRPMYKAGDLVQFRGLVRQQDKGWSRLWAKAAGAKVEVKLVPVTPDPEKPVKESSTTMTVGAYGTFSGEFQVPENAAGVFRLVARVAQTDHVSEIRVKDYVKPIFFVDLKSSQETLREGDKLRVQMKVERYAGGVPTGVRYRYMLFRTRVSLPEWVSDAGLGESGSTTTYGFDPGQKTQVSSLEMLASSTEEISLGDDGVATLEVEVPNKEKGPYDYQYLFKVYAFDADGNSAWGNLSFADVQSDVVAQIRTSGGLLEKGKKAEILVRAMKQSGNPYGEAMGTLKIFQRGYQTPGKEISSRPIKTGKDGLFKTEIPADLQGEITATIELKDSKGRPSRAEAIALVVPTGSVDRVVDVTDLVVMSNQEDFKIGEKARALLLLPEGWGPGRTNSGIVHVTIVGDQIHARRTLSLKGNAAWFELPIEDKYGTGVYAVFAYPDAANGWIEKRIRFRIPKQDRWLKVSVKADKAELNPGSQQKLRIKVLDMAGKPLKAEFSVSVVDKAVLDLQPEFRPGLLEFFYPTQRLNLMSFLSSHFQGYGYGERVAKLFKSNMGWAAPKGTPPEQMFEKDTAFWKARVMTDDKGEASVQFEVPPNQTTWIISVVAADNAGRFGEGRGDFKARRTHAVVLASPNAVRVGDMLDLRLSVMSNEKSNKKIPFHLDVSTDGGTVQGVSLQTKGEVSSKDNPTYYHRVNMSQMPANQSSVVTAKLKVANTDLRQDWKLKAISGDFDYTDYLKPNGSNFSVKLLPKEKIQQANLFIAQGLMGTILPSLEWMLQYPHGCVEQLTNTTVPNIMVSEFFNGKSMKGRLTPEHQQWLADATKNAQSGLQSLKNYQLSDGSFGWFSGETRGNESMTYFVLMSFASAPRIPGSPVSFWKALEYLNKNAPAPKSAKAFSLMYLDSWLNASPYDKMAVEKEAQIRFLSDAALSKEGTAFQRALILRTLNNYRKQLPEGLKPLQNQLIKAVEADVKTALAGSTSAPGSLRPTGGDWQEYVGEWSSGTAIAARALGEIGKFPKSFEPQLRAKMLEAFNGSNFGSTYETAQTLLNMLWFFEIEAKDAKVTQVPGVELDGKAWTPGKGEAKAMLGGYQLKLPLGNWQEGAHEVRVLASGTTRLVLNKSLPLDLVAARDEVAQIQKEYFKVNEKSGALTAVKDFKFQVGDLVYVKIQLTRTAQKRAGWASQYYAMKEFVPMGFSVIEQDSLYESSPYSLKLREKTNSRRVLRPDGIQWYFQFNHGWQDKGESVGYLMRANFSGTFIGGVTKFEDFYEEGLWSLRPGARFTVERR